MTHTRRASSDLMCVMHQKPDQPSMCPLRILFVSSTTMGGSGRSQRELAVALDQRGCNTAFLVDSGAHNPVGRRVLEELTDATVRFSGRGAGRVADTLRASLGSRPRKVNIDGVEMWSTIAPENSIAAVIEDWRPNVLVASSISRVTWRAVRSECRRQGIPTVLYLREETAIGHLTAGLTADLVIGNSASLVASAGRHGVDAEFLPSVVRLNPLPIRPTGEVALMVNPLPTHGVEMIGEMAAALPEIPIVLQESWSLDPEQQARVDELVASHPNLVFRAYQTDASRIFRDARVLLAPHRIDNRPRTVLEAQVNAIPVIATGHPGLVEAVGDGGVLLAPEAGVDQWIRALGSVWHDEEEHMRLSARARIHAARPEIDPTVVVDRFLELMSTLDNLEPAI